MAHDYKTRTIDYSEEHPPKWASPQEKIDFHPKRAAKLLADEMRRVEAEMEKKKAEGMNSAKA